ncbi:hypothetical protein ACU10_16765 [Xanthomonas oryzae pv. oryzicola]|nr:hypothetical protein BE73_17540 [Xanthomonas oryzae pv. oryzicola]AKN94424.1 hypothetical protein ACU13_16840 [Xanthomonas oryzae pv. oryzicola]AKN98148.1 hypothetical protein ACU10_16765 [Xanthomonas oryzae pv. oryzicola]AKO03606.1 hypothetical protein ACU16_04905 [Xanthomonas oryzae pv. oryzicola]AKO07496.1 hypothetical protein ACU17_04750 [Xanthomonas oryzae pv. oryzicola]
MRQLPHLSREALQRILCSTAIHLAQHHKARLSLHQRAYARAVESPFDEVAFPVPRNQALRHLFRPMDDTQLLRHPRALGSGRTAQAARRLVLTKRFHKLFRRP